MPEPGQTAKTAVNRAARALFPLHCKTLESGLGFSLDQLQYGSGQYRVAARLYENMARFSAAKLHTFTKQYLDQSDLIQKASVMERHAGHWHKAETITIHRQAQQARKWTEYEEDAPLYPNLTYDAVMDARTRPGHRLLNNITLPLTHPFWDTHYPPNDYGCRCDVRQARGKSSPEPLVNEKIENARIKPLFQNNAGKSGQLFKNHPYLTRHTRGMEKEVGTIAKNAVSSFLKQSKLRDRTVKKQIAYTDTTVPGNPVLKKEIEITATGTFINKIRLLDISQQLLALNWHQFPEMKKSTFIKEVVRGTRGERGKEKFNEFYSMRIDNLVFQFGIRKDADEYTMYYMKEIG